MDYIEVTTLDKIAVVAMNRGKVNALNPAIVRELGNCFGELEKNELVKAIVFTGSGKFFSFGLDVPELLSFTKESLTKFLVDFTSFYTTLYAYPKPVVAALNGHAIAGGCMLAIACDHRIMVSRNAKISLNEITFGASVFAGSVEMLKSCTGSRNAEKILYSGAMYEADEALHVELIDQVAAAGKLMSLAKEKAYELASRDMAVFRSMKALLREPVAREMRNRETESIREFVEIWYSESTQEQLKKIEIRD